MSSEQRLTNRLSQEPEEHQGSRVGARSGNEAAPQPSESEQIGQLAEKGLASGNGLMHNPDVMNGIGVEQVITNGAVRSNAAINGAPAGFISLVEPINWDCFLPERSSGLMWHMGQLVKRGIDILLASTLLVVLFPVFAFVALLVKLNSAGPAFYICEYIGHRGRQFMLYKFRTMVVDADSKKSDLNHLNHMNGPAFKIRNDPRITSVGRLLRKFSVDELPQLWNVFKGDMSLVGPRPPLPEEWAEYKDWHRAKLSTVPGITCYWQVSGRSDIVDFDEWASLDLKYIERWSLWEDFKILVRTVPAVLRGHGAY